MNKITKEKLIDILKNKATDCFIFNDDLVVDIKEKRMIIKDVENKNYYENIFNEKNIEKNAKKEKMKLYYFLYECGNYQKIYQSFNKDELEKKRKSFEYKFKNESGCRLGEIENFEVDIENGVWTA